jgi:hypothetical protein
MDYGERCCRKGPPKLKVGLSRTDLMSECDVDKQDSAVCPTREVITRRLNIEITAETPVDS